MIKLVMCLTRRSDLSREKFQDYWENSHGPFFMKNAGIIRAMRYLQSHTIASPLNDGLKTSRGLMSEYDGVAEIWFKSEEDLMEAMGSGEMQSLGEALMADEKNFIDHSRSSAFIVREVEF